MKKATEKCKQEIVVVQAGWVFVGEPSYVDDHLVLNNAKNIRVWGTNSGLGQLALHGKQAETVLDEYGVVKVPKAAILALIECQVEL